MTDTNSEVNDRLETLKGENSDLRRAVLSLFYAIEAGSKVDRVRLENAALCRILEGPEGHENWERGYALLYVSPSDERREQLAEERAELEAARRLVAEADAAAERVAA